MADGENSSLIPSGKTVIQTVAISGLFMWLVSKFAGPKTANAFGLVGEAKSTATTTTGVYVDENGKGHAQ